MGTAYWATYPISNSCISWSQRLTTEQKSNKISIKCDVEHLKAFLNYSCATLLSGFGWFTRMTIDTIVDLVS